MNYKQSDIERFLKTPDQNIRCILLFGTNEGMIAELTKKIALTVLDDLDDAFRTATFEMETIEKDAGVLFGEYNAVSLMGGRRVVFIKNANNNLTKPLKELMETSSSDTLLIMSSFSLNTKSSLVTFVKDYVGGALISCYEDRQENIYSFVKDFLIKNNMTISNDAAQLLCQRLSSDRKASLSELEKLITYAGSKRNIDLEDVQKAVSDTADSSVEDLCYLTASGQTQKALDSYQHLLGEGEEPVMLIRSLTYHFLKLLDCVALIENGSTIESAILSMKPPLMFYRKADFTLELKIWKRSNILDVLFLLYKAERDCKTTGYPSEEIASYTLMQISGAARKLQ